MKLTNRIILLFIILLATALRFYDLFNIPFTHDEFSALRRTNFGTFFDLIKQGVKPDGHPAGIQVFLFYWIKLFGNAEWVVKLPFLLFGTASVYIIYLIAKQWYNETLGLISASFLATIQYTVLYSQIARPYISGLFFCLLMVLYWSKLIKQTPKNTNKNLIFYILFSVLAAYNHYFSLLFAVIVWVSGLFYIHKTILVKYIATAGIGILLFLPHLKITIHQLGIGGVGGWLGAPSSTFLLEYIRYIFNYSTIVLLGVLALIIYSLFSHKKAIFDYRKLMLFGLWFLLPFLIGYFYSVYYNPVLQYSVLIFSFPFILFFLFGHIREQKTVVNLIIVLCILTMNTFSLIYSRKHYSISYKSPFEYILKDHNEIISSHESIESFLLIHDSITNYYKERVAQDTNYFDLGNELSDMEILSKLRALNVEYLFLGTMSGIRPTIIPLIQEYFPKLEWQRNYYNGTSYLFSKQATNKQIIENLDFETSPNSLWEGIDSSKIIDTVSFLGEKAFFIQSDMEWCPGYSQKLWSIIDHENNFIDLSVNIKTTETCTDLFLVAALYADDENIYWSSSSLSQYVNMEYGDNWTKIFTSLKLSDITIKNKDIVLKVFLWNKAHCNFIFDDFTISKRDGNPIIYGLQNDF